MDIQFLESENASEAVQWHLAMHLPPCQARSLVELLEDLLDVQYL